MMFVSGETCDPPVESTSLIEDIVHDQVVEILYQATALSIRRGSRAIAPEDLIFLIRHDKAKVNRLRTYLSWKDVRKNAKDQEGGGMEGTDILDDGLINGGGANGANGGNGANANGANGNANGGPGGASGGASDTRNKAYKKARVRLPWELAFQFREQPLEQEGENGEDDIDDEEQEANEATLKRLKTADDRTKQMTREEYVHFSECRQASFTYRKAKRFREWAGLASILDVKPHDDIIDILGFLTFEIVTCLTEEALKVKEQEEELEARNNKNRKASSSSSSTENGTNEKKRKRERHLFDGPEEEMKPIMARHIQEAFRRMQALKPKARALRRFNGGLVRTKPVIL